MLDASEWPGSLPQMEPLIADSLSRLLAKFETLADSGKSMDVCEYFGRFTMEVILASAFGRYKDIQSTEERNKLTDALATALGSINESSLLDGALLKRWLCEWHTCIVSVPILVMPVGGGSGGCTYVRSCMLLHNAPT